MKKKVLILSNSNFFTVMSSWILNKHFEIDIFNLRFNNEDFDKNEHMINQIREQFLDQDFLFNTPDLRYNFSFNEMFLYRINNFIKNNEPDVIFIELKNTNNNELKLIDFINKKHNIPIVAFNSNPNKNQTTMFDLAEAGVKELLTKYIDKNFNEAIFRNI